MFFSHAIKAALLVAALMLLVPAQAHAKQNITGVVKDKGGYVVPYTIIYVRGSEGFNLRTWADENGRFTLTGLAPGQYLITPCLIGLRPNSKLVTLSGPDVFVEIICDLRNMARRRFMSPGVPMNFTATAVSDREIRMVWEDSEGGQPSGYLLYDGSGTLIWVGERNFHRETGLTGATKYCYSVATFDISGSVSNRSELVCAKTLRTSTLTRK